MQIYTPFCHHLEEGNIEDRYEDEEDGDYGEHQENVHEGGMLFWGNGVGMHLIWAVGILLL